MTLTDDALAKLRLASTATLTSQLLKRGFRNTFVTGVRPLRGDLRMVGYAFTLRYVPAREDLGIRVDYDNYSDVQRLATESIGPDDVLVIDARSNVGAASFGHILATRIQRRGAAGLVTDGALRDTPEIREIGLPTYCRAAHATTSSVAHYPVEMNIAIGCGEVLVMPGDVMVGDAEGVVVIPAGLAEDVAHNAYEQELYERFALEKVRDGASIRGIYPLAEESRADFEAWLGRQKSELTRPSEDAARTRPRTF